VFPISSSAVIVGVLGIVIIGSSIGTLSGILVSMILKQRAQGIVGDAFLGLTGFVIILIGFDQGTTMNRLQHPFIAAVIVASALPALHQLFRFKHLGTGEAGNKE
jgi:hypothetical protein